nr:ATP-dependent Clp protease ATP-binding subunit [Salmonella sp. NCTC 7297]
MFSLPGRSEVTGANVLVAIFSEQESQAAYLLRKHEVSRLDVVNFISHGREKTNRANLPISAISQLVTNKLAGRNVWKTSRRILTNLLAWAASIR